MTWRFRTSFSPIPGVRLTLSPSGITTSVGIGPIRLTGSTRGSSLTISVPGTGLSLRQPLTFGGPSRPAPISSVDESSDFAPPVLSPDHLPTAAAVPQMHDIKSASSSVLTGVGLAAFKETLHNAQQQFATTERELVEVRNISEEATALCRSWEDGWFLRRIMTQRFARIRERADECQAKQKELEEQLELSRLNTQFEMPDGVAKAFARFVDDFSACARAQRIWDNVAHRATNRIAERTVATRAVDLKPVRFSARQCGVIQTAMQLPCLENANGGDIYVYPGFVVYHASATNYALIEFAEVDLKVERISFHEQQAVPADARQIGTTWAKTNKDGSPDRRFRDNFAIPVMEYAQLTLRSPAGLNEEYILSNVSAAENLVAAWTAVRDAVRLGA